jgi:hypothetical protein
LPGGDYKLCWGENPDRLTDFKVEIDDAFGLVGPFRANYTCDIGAPCDLVITGWGLDTTNQIMVVDPGTDPTSAGECGDPLKYAVMPGVASVLPASMGYEPDVVNTEQDETEYGLPPPFGRRGNFYKLCWSWQPVGHWPMNIGAFNVEVDGDFMLDIPGASDAGLSGAESDAMAETEYTEVRQEQRDAETGLYLTFSPNR